MLRMLKLAACALCVAWAIAPVQTRALAGSGGNPRLGQGQETGFLNRRVQVGRATYRFQVYLPEEWRKNDHKKWPVILFLHGRGERGSEGMWQTQIGLPQAVRDHPDRWPFVMVMPQCGQDSFWTDPEMLSMAMAALDQETREFHGDPDRTYLTGLSLGGYGVWELARRFPQRWAAVAVAASGIFWSYAPERWRQSASLPEQYAQAVGHTPVWIFHGLDDDVVTERQAELMYEALKESNGHVRLWVYQGLHHDCWTRAYGEPELPRWLLAHTLGNKPPAGQKTQAMAERQVIPLHPPAIKLASALLDGMVGEYRNSRGHLAAAILRQGEQLYQRTPYGQTIELAAESAGVLFYPHGGSLTRLVVERDAQGRVTALIFRDDRHAERWEKRGGTAGR